MPVLESLEARGLLSGTFTALGHVAPAGAGTMNVFRAAKGIGYGNAGPPPRQ